MTDFVNRGFAASGVLRRNAGGFGLALLLALVLFAVAPVAAQQDSSRGAPPVPEADTSDIRTADSFKEKGWRPFFRHEGVVASFVHYRRADNQNSGVVLRLVNENDFAVHYRLELSFLASDGEEDEWRNGSAEDTLLAGQMKAGSPDGLFWIPFEGGRGIAEIRLSSYEAVPVDTP